MSDRVLIFDTTLRDGEQSPGASMNQEEKLSIARLLQELRVDIIEAGFPIASKGDFNSVQAIAREIKDCQVAGLARAKHEDIETAWNAVKDAKNPRIHTFIATSPIHMQYKLKLTEEQVLEKIKDSVSFARNLCPNIEWSCEDGGRSSIDFLYRCIELASSMHRYKKSIEERPPSSQLHSILGQRFLANETLSFIFSKTCSSVSLSLYCMWIGLVAIKVCIRGFFASLTAFQAVSMSSCLALARPAT